MWANGQAREDVTLGPRCPSMLVCRPQVCHCYKYAIAAGMLLLPMRASCHTSMDTQPLTKTPADRQRGPPWRRVTATSRAQTSTLSHISVQSRTSAESHLSGRPWVDCWLCAICHAVGPPGLRKRPAAPDGGALQANAVRHGGPLEPAANVTYPANAPPGHEPADSLIWP